jgi:hypothetical protein
MRPEEQKENDTFRFLMHLDEVQAAWNRALVYVSVQSG